MYITLYITLNLSDRVRLPKKRDSLLVIHFVRTYIRHCFPNFEPIFGITPQISNSYSALLPKFRTYIRHYSPYFEPIFGITPQISNLYSALLPKFRTYIRHCFPNFELIFRITYQISNLYSALLPKFRNNIPHYLPKFELYSALLPKCPGILQENTEEDSSQVQMPMWWCGQGTLAGWAVQDRMYRLQVPALRTCRDVPWR